MASAFNLTAQINLQGPTNLKPIVANIKKELGGIKATVDLDVKASSAKNITAINSKLKDLSKFATNANASIKELNTSLSSLSSSFNKLASAGTSTGAGIESTNKSLGGTKKALSEATTEIEEFGKQSGLAIRRFAAFSTVTTVVYGLVNAFSSAFKEFVNFNAEIVRLSQVTGKSTSDLKDITNEITRLSTGLGVASGDLLTVASTLAQAGLSAEDTKIALEALAKSSLAPSFENLKDTTEGSIAVLRQFGLQAEDLEGALGSVNAVAAAFAVEAGDLITAVQRTGGVFATSSRGVSEGKDALNEFLAVFTSVRQTTRESAETIATGLRTIFTRIQRSDTIDQLRQFGIELTDIEGKFVGPYEAVRRLSEGLSKLDPRDIKFSGIVEELGGFRQIGKVIPLIQQFTVAQEALKVAQKGQDSLAKDAAAAQESLSNRFTKTRESFIALVRDIGDSGTFRALADVTLTLANSLITLAKALEPLLPLLVAFGAIKIGSGLTQFASGFRRGLGGGGGAAGGGSAPTPTGPGGAPSGSPKNDVLLANNTTALSALISPLNSLLQNISILNTTLNQTNVLLKTRPIGGGPTRGFARGGFVPGSGNRDTVRAMLTPGEFVIRKKAVQAIGLGKLHRLNGFANGGRIRKRNFFDDLDTQQFAIGGIVKDLLDGGWDKHLGAAILGYQENRSDTATGSGRISKSEILNKLKSILKSERGITDLITSNNASIFDRMGPLNFSEIYQGLPSELKNIFIEAIDNNIIAAVNGASAAIASFLDVPLPSIAVGTEQKNRFLAGINQATRGNLFEEILFNFANSNKALDKNRDDPNAPFDFPAGLPKGLFGRAFDTLPNKWVDAKASYERALRDKLTPKAFNQIIEDLKRAIATNDIIPVFAARRGRPSKPSPTVPVARAFGGSIPRISSKDTVPALLTPGEFVINKSAARRIGYHNLKRLNYADKIRGYNKGGIVGAQKLNTGGIVQRFAEGGGVGAIDLFAIGAIFTSILQPQVEKLANSFVDANGKVSKFAAGLSGAIREISSLVGSSLIGLSAVGASARDKAIGGVVAGVGGGLGGAFTDASGKALEEALRENTTALSKFDTLVQAANQATDTEEQVKASAKVQKSYAELVATFEKNKSSIQLSSFFKSLGDTITNTTTTFLVLQTSVLALNQAVTQATIAKQAETATSSGKTATESAGFLANLAISIPAIAKFGGFLKNAVLIGTRFLGWIGLAIAAIQLVRGIFSAFGAATQKAGEESLKLAEALRKSAESNTNFSLSNERFSSVLLDRYKELLAARSRGEISDTTLNRILSSINPREALRSSGTSAFNIKFAEGPEMVLAINELSTVFRTFIDGEAKKYGLVLDTNKGIIEGLQQLRDQGFGQQVNKFTDDLGIIFKQYLLENFQKLREREGVNVSTSTAEFNTALKAGGPVFQAIIDKVADYTAEVDRNKFATALITQSNLQLSRSVVTLNDVLNNFESRLSALTNTIDFNNKSLQSTLSLFEDQPKVTGGSDILRLQSQVLGNLKGFDSKTIGDAVANGLRLVLPSSVSAQTPDTERTRQEIVTNINALKTVEDTLAVLLTKVQGPQDTAGLDRLTSELTTVLKDVGQLSPDTASTIANSIKSAIDTGFQKGEALSASQIISQVTNLGLALESGKVGAKILSIAFEETAKVVDTVNENASQLARTLAKTRELESKRFEAVSGIDVELKKSLGIAVKSADLDKILEGQLKRLTGGPTTARAIVDFQNSLRQSAKDNIKARQSAPTNPVLTEEAANLTSQLQSSNDALQLIINSSDGLKRAFDNLIEKEKRLFSGPVNTFEELLKNPQKAMEIQRSLASDVPSMRSGTANEVQLNRILNVLVPTLESLGRKAEADQIRFDALEAAARLGLRQAQRSGDTQGIAAATRTLEAILATRNPERKTGQLQPEISAVETRQKEVDTAYTALIESTKAVSELLRSQGIIDPLNTFNTELPNIIKRRFEAENLLIDTINDSTIRRASQQSSQRIPSDLKSSLETVRSQLDPIIDRFKRIAEGQAKLSESTKGRDLFSPPGAPTSSELFAKRAGEAQKQVELLSSTTTDLVELRRNLALALSSMPSPRTINGKSVPGNFDEEYKTLRTLIGILDTLINQQKSSQTLPETTPIFPGRFMGGENPYSQAASDTFRLSAEDIKAGGTDILGAARLLREQQQQQQNPALTPSPVPLPAQRQQLQGQPSLPSMSPLDTSQLKSTFNNFVSSLSETLTAQSETFGDGLILRLNGVFSGFDKSINSFKSSSETLIAKLNDFNARGGIKGPNIPQEVSVKVGFDEELTVVAENGNSANILDNIGSLISSEVSRQLNEANVFGSVRRV